jgi:hypothetical protein
MERARDRRARDLKGITPVLVTQQYRTHHNGLYELVTGSKAIPRPCLSASPSDTATMERPAHLTKRPSIQLPHLCCEAAPFPTDAGLRPSHEGEHEVLALR